jgi:hypothetical protein
MLFIGMQENDVNIWLKGDFHSCLYHNIRPFFKGIVTRLNMFAPLCSSSPAVAITISWKTASAKN